ncbi:hypothetical protein [Amycolatopsis thermophila]|uniref:Uncharacterized protein n=1 Tax=Amycolatopsis thermophila TaxID=206084 RepID=A0ABU0EMU8_9PSEU|nr:hypothetical protein [Amycolatopsis thermophila]MDQ0376608.1 hypothetical protein [Amycolatopsis thermophila]
MAKMRTCGRCGHYCGERTCCHCAGKRRLSHKKHPPRRNLGAELDAFLHPQREGAPPVIKQPKNGKKVGVRNPSKSGKVKDNVPKNRGKSKSGTPAKWITAAKGITSVVTNPVGNGKRR